MLGLQLDCGGDMLVLVSPAAQHARDQEPRHLSDLKQT